VSYATLFVLTE